MSAVVRLDIVLRETVRTPYRDLVTRPMGAAVRDGVLSALKDFSGDAARLDFSDVGLIDFSCADEVVAKLLANEYRETFSRVILLGLHENHADAIEHALTRQDLIVVGTLVNTTRPQLLGAVPAGWHDVFVTLCELGRVPAEPVAEALEWTRQRVQDVLEGLALRRCVLSYPDATFELGAVA